MNLFIKVASFALLISASSLSADCASGRCQPAPAPQVRCCPPETKRCDQYECSQEYKRNYLLNLANQQNQNRNNQNNNGNNGSQEQAPATTQVQPTKASLPQEQNQVR